ncbi:MAG: hypothetical protein ACR2F6_05825, partial [Mycobacteriales bacterium]
MPQQSKPPLMTSHGPYTPILMRQGAMIRTCGWRFSARWREVAHLPEDDREVNISCDQDRRWRAGS